MQACDAHPITRALHRKLEDGSSAAALAAAVMAACLAIQTALHPVLGVRGVAALYQRSLHLAAAEHPALASRNAGAQSPMDLTSLVETLSSHSAATAAASGSALLCTFDTVLGDLIGRSLAQRLLQPVWTHSLGIEPSQGASP